MKNINYYNRVMIQIFILFIIMIFVSFIPDYLHDFFGDIYCIKVNTFCGWNIHYSPVYHWGYRHILWACCGCIIFIIQAIKIINTK